MSAQGIGLSMLNMLEQRFGKLDFLPMQVDDIDQVVAVEQQIYSHPWTRGNFLDSLYSGYQSQTLRTADGRLIGYFLVMLAVDEAHLLNISVAADMQHQGFGRLLLEQATTLARKHAMTSMLLEVRASNLHAMKVYNRYGFSELGRRRNYYPAGGLMREDAIVMSLVL
ncbi:ribosomal protein S18-alanine N-acetyltransferase [Herbaspirillum lusitanum]|uniref:[Ribosomal protein bS18]-alanine N-acetyltransferase n=1 Tax=Herbaspirillum lusitanum TaxID=213312 RepID=A0ABW9AAR6_9BURK